MKRRCDEKRYTIGQLAELSGVSARALRHYEDVGLLRPERTGSNYRVYRERDAKRLAQVLAMRACGLSLSSIRRLFEGSDADVHASLVAHLRFLREQGRSLEEAISRTKRAIAALERMEGMDGQTAFDELKKKELREFEESYGQETRRLYGDDAIDASNERMMGLSRDEWDAKELLEDSIKVQLRLAMASDDPAGVEAQELARMHERWIRIHWGDSAYSRQAHLGLARMYLADPRFRAYYDSAAGEGATEFLVSALERYLGDAE